MSIAYPSMRRRRAAVLVVLGLAGAGPASAGETCADRASLLRWLARSYGEVPAAVGLTSSGKLIELLQTKDGATWTLLVTSTSGRTCVLAVGEGWRARHSGKQDSPT